LSNFQFQSCQGSARERGTRTLIKGAAAKLFFPIQLPTYVNVRSFPPINLMGFQNHSESISKRP
jgi:hypothetical protein